MNGVCVARCYKVTACSDVHRAFYIASSDFLPHTYSNPLLISIPNYLGPTRLSFQISEQQNTF